MKLKELIIRETIHLYSREAGDDGFQFFQTFLAKNKMGKFSQVNHCNILCWRSRTRFHFK